MNTTEYEEKLSIEEAIKIAKILSIVSEERIPMILEVFRKADVNIDGLDELAEWKALTKQTALIDTERFIKEITDGRKETDGEFRIKVSEFNRFCADRNINSRLARKHLYEYGALRTSIDKGKIKYTVPIWNGSHNERYVVIIN